VREGTGIEAESVSKKMPHDQNNRWTHKKKVQGIGIEKMLSARKEIKKEGRGCAGRGFTIYEGENGRIR